MFESRFVLSLRALSVAALIVALPLGASARSRHVEDALYELDAASKDARDNARCDEAIGRKLRNLRQDVEDLGRDPSTRDLERLADDASHLARDARDCPRGVERALRSAADALDDAARGGSGRDRRRDRDDRDRGRDRDRDRDRDRKEEAANVPMTTFSTDCQATWFMHRFVSHWGKADDLTAINGVSAAACGTGQLGEIRYPNGNVARFSNGEWRYPNGNTARFTNGELRYPNGNTARFSNDEWRYPNGNTARFSNGQWRYPNGNTAGDWQAIQGWACSVLGKAACDELQREYKSDLDTWRNYALVRLAYLAGEKK